MRNREPQYYWLLILAVLAGIVLSFGTVRATTGWYQSRVIDRHGNGQYNVKVELRAWADTNTTLYYDTTDASGIWGTTIEAGDYAVFVDSVYNNRFIFVPDVTNGTLVLGSDTGDTIRLYGVFDPDSGSTLIPDSAVAAQRADTADVLTGAIDSTRATQKADSAYTWAAYADTALAAQRADTASVYSGSVDSAIAAQRSDSAKTWAAFADTASTCDTATLALLADTCSGGAVRLAGRSIGTSGTTIPLLDGANTYSGKSTFSDSIIGTDIRFTGDMNVGDDILGVDSLDARSISVKDLYTSCITDTGDNKVRIDASYLYLGTDEAIPSTEEYLSLSTSQMRVIASPGGDPSYTIDMNSSGGLGYYNLTLGSTGYTGGASPSYYTHIIGDKITLGTNNDIVVDSCDDFKVDASDNIELDAEDTVKLIGTYIDCSDDTLIDGYCKGLSGWIDSAVTCDTATVALDADTALAAQRSDSAKTWAAFADTSRAAGTATTATSASFSDSSQTCDTATVALDADYSDTTLAAQRSDSAKTWAAYAETSATACTATVALDADYADSTITAQRADSANTWAAFAETSATACTATVALDADYADSTITAQRSDSANTWAAFAETSATACTATVALTADAATLADSTTGGSARVGGYAIGTSGTTIPLLDGVNTWSGLQTFDAGATISSGQSLTIATAGVIQGVNNTVIKIDTVKIDAIRGKVSSELIADVSGNDIIFQDSVRAGFFVGDTIISTYCKGLDGWVDSAVTCDTATVALDADYADSAITSQRADSANTWAAFAETSATACTATVALLADTAGGAVRLAGLAGSAYGVLAENETPSGVWSFGDSLKVTTVLKTADVVLSGVILSASDTVLVPSSDDATIHGNLTVRESLYVTEGARINTDLTVDDSIYTLNAQIQLVQADTVTADTAQITQLGTQKTVADSFKVGTGADYACFHVKEGGNRDTLKACRSDSVVIKIPGAISHATLYDTTDSTNSATAESTWYRINLSAGEATGPLSYDADSSYITLDSRDGHMDLSAKVVYEGASAGEDYEFSIFKNQTTEIRMSRALLDGDNAAASGTIVLLGECICVVGDDLELRYRAINGAGDDITIKSVVFKVRKLWE